MGAGDDEGSEHFGVVDEADMGGSADQVVDVSG
jgi:hypothetical protein